MPMRWAHANARPVTGNGFPAAPPDKLMDQPRLERSTGRHHEVLHLCLPPVPGNEALSVAHPQQPTMLGRWKTGLHGDGGSVPAL